jgi:hypothetical protein
MPGVFLESEGGGTRVLLYILSGQYNDSDLEIKPQKQYNSLLLWFFYECAFNKNFLTLSLITLILP